MARSHGATRTFSTNGSRSTSTATRAWRPREAPGLQPAEERGQREIQLGPVPGLTEVGGEVSRDNQDVRSEGAGEQRSPGRGGHEHVGRPMVVQLLSQLADGRAEHRERVRRDLRGAAEQMRTVGPRPAPGRGQREGRQRGGAGQPAGARQPRHQQQAKADQQDGRRRRPARNGTVPAGYRSCRTSTGGRLRAGAAGAGGTAAHSTEGMAAGTGAARAAGSRRAPPEAMAAGSAAGSAEDTAAGSAEDTAAGSAEDTAAGCVRGTAGGSAGGTAAGLAAGQAAKVSVSVSSGSLSAGGPGRTAWTAGA